MPTPIWLTGFEYGLNPTVNGGGLFDTISGVPTVVTNPVASGVYALSISPSGSTVNARKTFAAMNVMVFRVKIRFDTLPSATSDIMYNPVAAGLSFRLRYTFSTNKFSVGWGASFLGGQSSSMTLETGVWYRIDFRITINTNPRTIEWKINGVDQTTSSYAETGSTTNGIIFGSNATSTYTCFYDDMYVSQTPTDYPIGDSAIYGKSPDSDGTHNAGTNVMEDQAGADIGVVTAWDLLDNVPMNTTADYVRQAANGTGNYAEVNFADITQTVINGVSAILAYNSATATANTGATIIRRSDATEIEVYGTPATPLDMSETALFYKSVVVTAPGGGWTQAEVNALKARIGYSSDANPDPYWQALMLEVDVVAANTVYQDLQAKWDMRALVNQDLQAKYDMRVLVNQDLQAKYDMRSLVGQNLQSLWDMIGVVNQSLQALWDMRTLVSQDLQAKYDITTLVNKDVQALWDMRNLANQSLQAKYDITTLINKDLQNLWDILGSSTLVNKDLQALWDVTQLVNKDTQALWDVRNLVDKNLQAVYDIENLAIVNKDLQALYDVKTLAGQEMQAVYDIANLTGQELQAKWDVRNLVWNELASQYGVGGMVMLALTVRWRLGTVMKKKAAPLVSVILRRRR